MEREFRLYLRHIIFSPMAGSVGASFSSFSIYQSQRGVQFFWLQSQV